MSSTEKEINLDEANQFNPYTEYKSRTHGFSVQKPADFKQLLATGRRNTFIRRKTAHNPHSLFTFTQKLKEKAFNKSKKAYDSYHNSRRASIDMDMAKSRSTPRVDRLANQVSKKLGLLSSDKVPVL